MEAKSKCDPSRGLLRVLITTNMLTYLHYALATVCFAASVGCLALWPISHWKVFYLSVRQPSVANSLETESGYLFACRFKVKNAQWRVNLQTKPPPSHESSQLIRDLISEEGHFASIGIGVMFPLWYSALVFALAGVVALRFRRQFSIRSALVAVSVVAALLGMIVAL
jgi:hypothetical protein